MNINAPKLAPDSKFSSVRSSHELCARLRRLHAHSLEGTLLKCICSCRCRHHTL